MAKKRISAFFNSEIQAMLNKYRQIEELVPKQQVNNDGRQAAGADHTAEEGRFIESIVRSALNKYLPKNLKSFSGFILRPETMVGENDKGRTEENLGDQHSKQLDIIVYDIANYPIYEQFEEFAIVPPEGVIAVISVKKTLRLADIEHELETLADAASLCRHYVRKETTPLNEKKPFEKIPVIAPASILLSFTSELGAAALDVKVRSIFEQKIKHQEVYPYDAIIKLITVLDSFSILKTEENTANIKPKGVKTTFAWYKHEVDDEEYFDVGIQLLIQSILKVYYHRTRSPFVVRPGFEKIDDVFKVKERFLPIFSKGYRIEKEVYTKVAAQRGVIRQRLLSTEKAEADALSKADAANRDKTKKA